jgi:hypothetical protein
MPHGVGVTSAAVRSRPGPPGQSAIAALRARYDIEQLTPMIPDRR